jgi:hypothetical protein
LLDPKLGVDVDVNGPGLCAAATPQPDPSAPAATSAEVTNFMEVFPAFMPERHRIEGHDAAFFNLAAPRDAPPVPKLRCSDLWNLL